MNIVGLDPLLRRMILNPPLSILFPVPTLLIVTRSELDMAPLERVTALSSEPMKLTVTSPVSALI